MDDGLESSALAGATLDSILFQGNRAPKRVQTKSPPHPLKQATPSLWRLGSLLLGATVMGEKASFPRSTQSSKPQSSVLQSLLPEGLTNPRSAAHPQLSYQRVGAGQ